MTTERTRQSEYTLRFTEELVRVAQRLDLAAVDDVARALRAVRDGGGRVFCVGVGGGAANASHAVCDFRGLAGLESYAPTDNSAALTAAINDYGWRDSISRWLTGSRIGPSDALLVFSVGGGSEEPPVSVNLVEAVRTAKRASAFVCGVVGPNGGETRRLADVCITVPVSDPDHVTTHTEIFQSVVWHLLVTHPELNRTRPHWEGLR
ncbi:SIS domain-containing protein [Streptomyces sp. NPDC059989]|uniref:SIS domain-containing protein n=1 Tax=Streptomyces sp. NPDC059989 TaxID=3347026 RepID=UPI0036AE37EC